MSLNKKPYIKIQKINNVYFNFSLLQTYSMYVRTQKFKFWARYKSGSFSYESNNYSLVLLN